MRNINFKKVTKHLLIIALTVCMFFTSAFSAIEYTAEDFAKELNQNEYYGRNALKELSNAENLLFVYNNIAEGIENTQNWTEKVNSLTGKRSCKTEILISDSSHLITRKELETAFEAYRNDFPQHFWLGSAYTVYTNLNGTISKAVFSCDMSKADLLAMRAKFNSAVEEFLSDIPSNLDEYETEKSIHDKLIKSLTYSNTKSNAYSAYGALINKSCVCEGYAEAFQYLLYKRGIQAFRITGVAGGVGHAWTVVRIDGNYYHVDPTWNDGTEDYISYAYFNLTTKQILKSHEISEYAYKIPTCTETNANYFEKEGIILNSSITASEAAKLFKASPCVRAYVYETNFNLQKWFFDNVKEIAKGAGIRYSYSYSCGVNGNEFYMTLIERGITVSGVVTSFNGGPQDVKIQMFKDGSDIPTHETVLTGNYSEFSFQNVKPGIYTLDVLKDNHVTTSHVLVVTNTDIKTTTVLYLIGDVDNDGKITEKDAEKIANHVKGTKLLQPGETVYADVALDDGKVTAADYGKINAFLKDGSQQ